MCWNRHISCFSKFINMFEVSITFQRLINIVSKNVFNYHTTSKNQVFFWNFKFLCGTVQSTIWLNHETRDVRTGSGRCGFATSQAYASEVLTRIVIIRSRKDARSCIHVKNAVKKSDESFVEENMYVTLVKSKKTRANIWCLENNLKWKLIIHTKNVIRVRETKISVGKWK